MRWGSARIFPYLLRLRRAATAPCADMPRTVYFILMRESIGEAAPSPSVGETVAETGRALERILAGLDTREAEAPADTAAWLKEKFPLHPAARAAIEMIVFDQAAREAKQPLHAWLRLPSPEGQATSYTLSLGPEAEIEQRLAEGQTFATLQLRCGGPAERDVALIKWIARQTRQALRINARGCWTADETRAMISELAKLNIEYIEQPLPAHRIEETAALAKESPLPILLDEDARSACTLERLVGCCNGVAVKLMPSGGLCEALRLIRRARELGLRVALDATQETGAGVTAAAHLAGAADYVNLSQHLPLENDPIRGMRIERGQIVLTEEPGVGIAIKDEYRDLFPLGLSR